MRGLNPLRFSGKPLKQPSYKFSEIIKVEKNLKGSILEEVTEDDRDYLHECMSEIVLLCNEAIKRNCNKNNRNKSKAKKKGYSKPLSLEYIADRMDVDDPLWGFMVRSDQTQNPLQGFITVTTFTNWQKTFRWDSMHDSAFSYDDDNLSKQMAQGFRKYDHDGTLAQQLQATVRCGDPWNEGIVWPRIAEISLLGGLGCGKALLSLVIERLERMNASGNRNYDYVVLQATDNSIPFYESLGFIRVGGITEDDKFHEKKKERSDNESEQDEDRKKHHNNADNKGGYDQDDLPNETEIVSSPVQTYIVKKNGENPKVIAKKFDANVWDIIFLNKFVYKDIAPTSRLLKGTSLFLPSSSTDETPDITNGKYVNVNVNNITSAQQTNNASAPQWYICNENDTPRMISKKFQVNCKELVAANRERLPELISNSRLKEGTRIKVSHFHIHDDQHIPYCHWTFPDDTLETSETSYMMAFQLNRQTTKQAKIDRPVEERFAIPVTKHVDVKAPNMALSQSTITYSNTNASHSHNNTTIAAVTASTSNTNAVVGIKSKKRKRHPSEPVPPKQPLSAFFLFNGDHRESVQASLRGEAASEVTKVLAQKWKKISDEDKLVYQNENTKLRKSYHAKKEKYQVQLAEFYKNNPECIPDDKKCYQAENNNANKQQASLFNKVVKLNNNKEGQTLHCQLDDVASEFEYYYVLTYIPDLQWCHLAPMRKIGTYGTDRPRAEGRPIWMLVHEKEGKELDISASLCEVVRTRSMKRTVDADEEQWDILESGYLARSTCNATAAAPSTHSALLVATTTPGQTGAICVPPLTFLSKFETVPSKVHIRVNGVQMPKVLSLAIPAAASVFTNSANAGFGPSTLMTGISKIACPACNAQIGPSKVPKHQKSQRLEPPNNATNNNAIDNLSISLIGIKNGVPSCYAKVASSKEASPKRRGRPPKNNATKIIKITSPAYNAKIAPCKVPKRQQCQRYNSSNYNNKANIAPSLSPIGIKIASPVNNVQISPSKAPTRRGRPPKNATADAVKISRAKRRGRPLKHSGVETTKKPNPKVSVLEVSPPRKHGLMDKTPPKRNHSTGARHANLSEKAVKPKLSQVEVPCNTGPFAVGDVVRVEERMWPGVNKPGGVARVTKVYAVGSVVSNICYDLSYVLGGREKNVDACFVWQEIEQRSSSPLPTKHGKGNNGRRKFEEAGRRNRPTRQAAPTSLKENFKLSLPSRNHNESKKRQSIQRKDGTAKPSDFVKDINFVPGEKSIIHDAGGIQSTEDSPVTRRHYQMRRTPDRKAKAAIADNGPRIKRTTFIESLKPSDAVQDDGAIEDDNGDIQLVEDSPVTRSCSRTRRTPDRSAKSIIGNTVSNSTIVKMFDIEIKASLQERRKWKRKAEDLRTDMNKNGVIRLRHTRDGGKRNTPVRKAAPIFGKFSSETNKGRVLIKEDTQPPLNRKYKLPTTVDERIESCVPKVAPIFPLRKKANSIVNLPCVEINAPRDRVKEKLHLQRLAPIFTKNARKKRSTSGDVCMNGVRKDASWENGGLNTIHSPERKSRPARQAAPVFASSPSTDTKKQRSKQTRNLSASTRSPLLLGPRREARITRAAA